jgi:hypothetical protein
VTDSPDHASRQFRDMMRGLEFLPNGKLVDLEPCKNAIEILVWVFNNHLEAVRAIDFNTLSADETALFHRVFTRRMNEALIHLEGLNQHDIVTVGGNTMALVSRSGGDGFYPQVLSDRTYARGTLERLIVAELPDQAGMDLIRLEINNDDGGRVITDNMTLDYAGLAMVVGDAKIVSDDPNIIPIVDDALVLVPIHYVDVVIHRAVAPTS